MHVRGILQHYLSRGLWDITNPLRFVSSKRPADVALAFGGAVSSDDIKALAKFEELIRKDMLGISVPAPCALKATTNERDATCEAIIDFYHACATSSIPEVKLVGKKAMKACSLLISSSNVESSFSVITNNSAPNRLRGGARYLYNLAMLTVNKQYLVDIYAREASKLGRYFS